MARLTSTITNPRGLAPLNIANLSSESAPLPQLDALWHYECVVSPRSTVVKPQSSSPVRPDDPSSPSSPSSFTISNPASSPISRFAPAHRALQRVFSTFDEDGDGTVSTQEISTIVKELGISGGDDCLQSTLMADIPSSATPGHVNEEQFVQLYESACSFLEQLDADTSSSGVGQDLLAAFHVFDKDGNGFISPAELQSVLCSLGLPQGRQLEDCVDMIARVDENGDGQVDFFEFKKLFHTYESKAVIGGFR